MEKEKGVRTFTVRSFTNAAKTYTLTYIRNNRMRRWLCECGDFQYRKMRRKRHCKHLRAMVLLAKAVHGVSRIRRMAA